MKKIKGLLALFTFVIYTQATAQVITVIDRKGTIVDVNNNKVTTAATAPSNPINGDIWFDTTLNIAKLRENPNWKPISKQRFGDIKYGLQGADHDGWVILNGRTIGSLTAAQQSEVLALGFSGNLPNAENRTLMMRTTGSIGDIGGNVQIQQQNLPNVNFSGTAPTSTDGAHNHTGEDAHASGKTPRGNANFQFLTGNRIDNRVMQNAGNHSHTASAPSGGSDVPIILNPSFISINVFIFLGD
jgi:hypothetical protein